MAQGRIFSLVQTGLEQSQRRPGADLAEPLHRATGPEAGGYVLQKTADLNAAGGGWTDVTQTPVVNGANKEVTLLATDQVCFFRLCKP